MIITRIYISLLALLYVSFSFSFALKVNNELIDEVNTLDMQQEPTLNFETFSSCEDMTSTLEAFITDNFKNTNKR
jgi:hypothetical protein